ncbi:MAG TPA: hypothetical protein VI504_09570, partial [Candidatus Eisenbacteria bacterium]
SRRETRTRARRAALPAALFAALLAGPAPGARADTSSTPPAHAVALSDSTVADAWRLANGLEVRTRHVPRAPGVSVTLAFRAGAGYEPAGEEGLSELLAELEFMCAAGSVPERTRAEMASLRPLGWESSPGTRLVRFTEIASAAQLPGVLQQFAARIQGVTVTDAALKAALAQVRRDAGERLFGEPALGLYWRSAAVARGLSDEQILRRATMPGLSKLNAREVTGLLHAWYQAGNASLGLAGDLSGIDVHALVGAAFDKLPPGTALPDTVEVRLAGAKRTMTWKGLTAPVGVVAASSPPLGDSLHAAFFLGMLVTGAGFNTSWGPPKPPLAARFQYSLLDEPELVRFYPPVAAGVTDPDLLAGAVYEQLQVVGGQLVTSSMLDRVRQSVRWLLGGELPVEVLARFRAEARTMGTLSSGMATRALWRGDPFWARYLGQLDRLALGHNYFYEWLADPKHQTLLLFTPGP